MRQAILGAGSLGTILGALLTKEGYDIDLIDTWPEHVDALNKNGASITGKTSLNVPVRAFTPDQVQGQYDIIYYLVKTTRNSAALPFVQKHLKSDGCVVVMQNGLPEEEVAKKIGENRVIGCPIGWGATLTGPGVSELTSEVSVMTYAIGELDGTITSRVEKIAEILNHAGTAHVSDSLMGIRWGKLVSNATFSGLSTVMGCTFGEVLDTPKALYCAATIAKEAIAVAGAAGIIPCTAEGGALTLLAFNNKEEYENLIPIYQAVAGQHRNLKASMLQDIEKGQPCEIATINGAMGDWAKKYGIPAPINDQITSIIYSIESGEMKPDLNNVDLINIS